MPAAARQSDMCTGHPGCKPRPALTGSPNVFINGRPAHRVGDAWAKHCGHGGVLATGSSSVFVNGLPLGRVGDAISCQSMVATGSLNVFAGG
ncbi:PAAR domain-containing protein [Halomonas organivorans]|uniref:Putative Zn-binding protein involved in type VI secretion n=1 Tax=Halomonas organivorans TaxID=257772 RepID=A0A7W5BY29_9GAMM|nr:PAAR domain-containing protein [Halomonas organivorans]MBB3141210.1 putative Zn-binding protein involved in type VI secretion [Halomonas organivorans]